MLSELNIVHKQILKNSFSVCCLLMLAACTDKNPGVSFPVVQSLVALETKATSDMYMRYPFRVRLVGSHLYMMDLHATEYYCHQFAYPSMTYIRSFGKRGEAPDELLDAENIRFDSEGKLWLLDANKSKLTAWTIEDATQAKDISLDEKLMRVLDFVPCGDSCFLVPDYSGTQRFYRVNSRGEIMERHFSIPTNKDHDLLPPVVLSQAWRAFMDYNPQNGVLAMATQLGHVLEIYHPDRKEVIAIKVGEHDEPRFTVKEGYAVPSGIMGYSDVYVGEKQIYALFWGHSFEEMKRSQTLIEGGNQLEVFDLNGEPVKKYILDRNVTGFHIDENTNRLIALDTNSDEPVVIYKLI